jgi:hypothetical protein
MPLSPPPLAGPFVAEPGITMPITVRMPSLDEIAAVLDPRTSAPALLSAAGGGALVILGFRTLFGGRRRRPPAPPVDIE